MTLKVSTLITGSLSLLAILVTVVLWILKLVADTKEKPPPLVRLR